MGTGGGDRTGGGLRIILRVFNFFRIGLGLVGTEGVWNHGFGFGFVPGWVLGFFSSLLPAFSFCTPLAGNLSHFVSLTSTIS